MLDLSDLDDSTAAAYLRRGIDLGLWEFEAAKSWAFQRVEELSAPSIELIEVATANTRENMREALAAFRESPDKAEVARAILLHLHELLKSEKMVPINVALTAQKVLIDGDLGKEAYYKFVVLEDQIELAHHQISGTMKAAQEDLDHALLNTATLAT